MTLSAFTRFHVSIGWTGVAFGFIALALRAPDFLCFMDRLPLPFQNFIRSYHSVFGGLYLICCIFMPITANWIWPRFGTPYEIIILIASMYISLILGIAALRLYKSLNSEITTAAAKVVDSREKELHPSDSPDVNNSINSLEMDMEGKLGTDNKASYSSLSQNSAPQMRYVWLKYAHAILMLYSLVMLLGAGQAFLANSRMNKFPYKDNTELTDSLVGRCYGRNLIESDTFEWLKNLSCGYTSFCQESTMGGRNKFA